MRSCGRASLARDSYSRQMARSRGRYSTGERSKPEHGTLASIAEDSVHSFFWAAACSSGETNQHRRTRTGADRRETRRTTRAERGTDGASAAPRLYNASEPRKRGRRNTSEASQELLVRRFKRDDHRTYDMRSSRLKSLLVRQQLLKGPLQVPCSQSVIHGIIRLHPCQGPPRTCCDASSASPAFPYLSSLSCRASPSYPSPSMHGAHRKPPRTCRGTSC